MHYPKVSKNYDWLPHNVDPSVETPEEYKDMVVQPFGDKQSWYDEMIQGCVDYYGENGTECIESERGRVEMSLRQPKVRATQTKGPHTLGR